LYCTVQQIIRLLSIANNGLPAVENRCQQLRREEVSLKFSNQNAAKTFQDLNNQISDEYKTLDQYRLFCKQKKQEIDKILQQKTGLQEYIECFQKNNNAYLRIKETIKLEVKRILTNPRQLLSTALVSLIESSRIDPRKFSALCYNKDITTTTSSTIDNSQYDYESSMNEELLPLDYSSSESFEKMLLDEAEKLYNKIIDGITSKTINFANGKNIWSFQPETRLPHVERESLHKLSTFTYRKEEEQSFIQSEIGNEKEDQDSWIQALTLYKYYKIVLDTKSTSFIFSASLAIFITSRIFASSELFCQTSFTIALAKFSSSRHSLSASTFIATSLNSS
jgi:hypothetical protein